MDKTIPEITTTTNTTTRYQYLPPAYHHFLSYRLVLIGHNLLDAALLNTGPPLEARINYKITSSLQHQHQHHLIQLEAWLV